MANSRIFVCDGCSTMAMLIQGDGQLACCGKEMKALEANTTDASQEKHVPVVQREGNRVLVKVGSAAHPMTDAHWIQWIYLQTKRGGQYRHLAPADAPEAAFLVAEDDEPVAAYAYCNLHGLWKAGV